VHLLSMAWLACDKVLVRLAHIFEVSSGIDTVITMPGMSVLREAGVCCRTADLLRWSVHPAQPHWSQQQPKAAALSPMSHQATPA
jgi:hypothetical protein